VRVWRAGAALLALTLLVAGVPARAHDAFEISTDAHVSGAEMRVLTTLSLLTATRTCSQGPAALRTLAPNDFEAARPSLEACARAFYRITSGGVSLPVRAVSVSLTVEADVEMKVVYARPAKTPLVFEAPRLKGLPERAGVVLTVTGERTFLGQQLLRPDAASLALPISTDAEAPGTPPLPSFRQYLALGIHHILTGYDHLLFLVGLLVVCRSLRTVAVTVSCFTLAHSVTLALAALDVVQLSAQVVEPLIAATLVFVGIENILRGEELKGRWALTFGFGLVHGLGFAGALREVGLGSFGTSIVGPLVAFNLGVEVGQLAVAALLLALLWRLRRLPALARYGTQLASLIVATIGLGWLIQRCLLGAAG
jgi:hypothetical protein